MKDYAKAFYKSQAWKRCREGYIKSVGGLCERCLLNGLIVPGYIVHHKCYITPENIHDISITLNWNNLEYLCKSHHDAEHLGQRAKKRFTLGINGKITANEYMDSI